MAGSSRASDTTVAGSSALETSGARRRSGSGYAAIVIVLLIVAMALRLTALDSLPLPIQQDELSDIYDGYCIATTGADRTGASWPILVRAMGPGDYRPTFYTYLAAVSTYFGGFSVAAGRLPAVVVGLVTVLLVFFAARSIFGRTGGLIALALIAVSPVHVMYSRQAHAGASLPPLFSVLSVYLLYLSLQKLDAAGGLKSRGTYLAILAAGLCIGLATSTYGAQRMTAFLFAALGAVLLIGQLAFRNRSVAQAAVAAVIFAVAVALGAAPQIYAAIAQPELFFARTSEVMYPLENGPRWIIEHALANLAANLDPRYLFLSFGTYAELTIARLSVVSLPFLYVGLIWSIVEIVRRRSLAGLLILGGVLISLAPTLISDPNPNAMRSSGVWSIYPLLTTAGMLAVGSACMRLICRREAPDTLEQSTDVPLRLAVPACVVGVILAVGAWNTVSFLNHPEWHGEASQNHLVRIGRNMQGIVRDYDRIYVDSQGVFAYLYVSIFSGMSPQEFREAPRDGTVTAKGWDEYHRFGKFRFMPIDQAREEWVEAGMPNNWCIVGGDDQLVDLSFPKPHTTMANTVVDD